MTSVARWQPARLPRPQTGAVEEPAGQPRQFVCFTFYALDPAWLRLDAAVRQAGAQELAAVIVGCRERLVVHSYTTFGLRAGTDFLLWGVSDTLDDFEAMAVAMRRTHMGRCLQAPYSCLAVIGAEAVRPVTHADGVAVGGRYLLVCPLVRTAAWDALTEEERGDITRELMRVGSETPGAQCGTTFCVGWADHDAVLTFEADRPEKFLGLIGDLRRTRSSLYAQRDTPIFTCTHQDPATLLARVGGV